MSEPADEFTATCGCVFRGESKGCVFNGVALLEPCAGHDEMVRFGIGGFSISE